MDDPHTQKTLDALADLFLTNVQAREPRRPQAPANDPLSGPAPIRLAPKPAAASQPAPATPQEPQLRLHRDEPHAPRHPQASVAPFLTPPTETDATIDLDPPAAVVEAVMLGNLPGLAGPWLTQYCQLLAQKDGPVAILHVDDDRIDVELVEPASAGSNGDPVMRVSSRIPPRVGEGLDLVDQLEALVRDPRLPVRTILVHVDPAAAPPDLARALALDDWTLLCGADDAAIVGAYRMLKQLTDADKAAARKHVGLMIMGSDKDVARAAAQKVKAAAASFLQTPVELIGWQQQMVPVNLRQIGSWDAIEPLWPRLVDWFGTLEQPEPIEAMKPETIPTAAPDPEPPTPNPQPPTPTFHEAPDLAAFLTADTGPVPGGVALDARCPQQTHTQLLLDQHGRTHLLRRHTSNNGCTDNDLRAAILDLIQSRRWVREHLDLLQLTQRQCRFDADAEPAMHLFTDRGDLATGLVARLGAMLQLHLLHPVEVGPHRTWFCTPLS